MRQARLAPFDRGGSWGTEEQGLGAEGDGARMAFGSLLNNYLDTQILFPNSDLGGLISPHLVRGQCQIL